MFNPQDKKSIITDSASKILAPKPKNDIVEIGGEEYEVLPDVVNEALIAIMLTWDKLGRPKTVFSESGEKLMQVIIATWQDLYPKESRDWLQARLEYKRDEKSISQQVSSHSGRSLASIPLYIHKIMKAVFKEDTNLDRKYYIKLVKDFPIFQMANKV